MTTPSPESRAIVLGASMAGLLSARILAERFDEVLLIERDELPAGPEQRRGTPQAIHAHGLLARGKEILESLFPGFVESLAARGARVGDIQAMVPMIAGGRRFAAGHAGIEAVAASRLLIEAEVRRRVLALPRVRLVTGDALGLRTDTRRARVTGVLVGLRDRDGHRLEQAFEAALVVDATGRGSRTPAWLKELGYEAPLEEKVSVGIAYATAYFRRQPQQAGGVAAIICSATPELTKSGVLIAQEPGPDGLDRWVVTLAGYAGDHPEPTLEGIRRRAREMRCPELVEVTHEAVPLGPITRAYFPHSVRRRYERLRRFPAGFLVTGDALASFNPIYGQGMTVAACSALALRKAVAGRDVSARAFFRAAARVIDTPWQVAVGADLAIDGVPGPRPAPVRLLNRYMARVFGAAERDPVVALAFIRVAQLVSAPASLLAPGILWRVLAGRRGGAEVGVRLARASAAAA